jgi:hypothetical protein
MADLSSHTAVYVRQSGNDATADGSLNAPYATAQAAFEAAYGLPSGTNYVLDFDAGSFGGVNLGVAGASSWPQNIAVRGAGPTASFLEGISASGNVSNGSPNPGKSITVVSDKTINIGNLQSSGVGVAATATDGSNGGTVILTDCICGVIVAVGGAGGEDYGGAGNGGNGGQVTLTNTESGAISVYGGVSAASGGDGGDVFLTDSVVDGEIQNYGGSAASFGGNGGDCSVYNSRCGNIDSRGATLNGSPRGETGVATFSGYSILPNIVYASVYAATLKQGKGVNGSAILGIV